MQPANAQEQVIWEGTPSQWLNFKTFVLSVLACKLVIAAFAALWASAPSELRGREAIVVGAAVVLLIVPIFVAIRGYLRIKCTRYVVTTERVRITRGIFSKRTADTELYRVDDHLLVEPFLLRLVSRGSVVLTTSDRSTPRVVLEAVPGARPLMDQLRKYIEACRDRKKTRVVDFEPQTS